MFSFLCFPLWVVKWWHSVYMNSVYMVRFMWILLLTTSAEEGWRSAEDNGGGGKKGVSILSSSFFFKEKLFLSWHLFHVLLHLRPSMSAGCLSVWLPPPPPHTNVFVNYHLFKWNFNNFFFCGYLSFYRWKKWPILSVEQWAECKRFFNVSSPSYRYSACIFSKLFKIVMGLCLFTLDTVKKAVMELLVYLIGYK